MPEIGRPVTPQQAQYNNVQIGPKALSKVKQKTEAELREDIINKATGYKPKDATFKEGPHNQMGKDEFMKLLSYQLQNQDPMNPMDQSKFTGELAQFSQLEQLTAMNKKLEQNGQAQAMQNKFYAASFVGKKVVTQGSTMNLKEAGESADVLFKLEKPAAKVLVRILDEKNNVSSEMWRDNLSEGGHQFKWDGMALDGHSAPKGTYRAVVKAWDGQGNEVGARTEATGIVQSVSFEEGEPVLSVNGQKVFLRDVTSFHTAETNTHEANTSALSNQGAPMLRSSNTVPTQQAMNAYSENAGIYE